MKALRRILLVEDDPDVQIVASLALTDLGGFDVEVCDSAEAALRKAPSFAPDLILMDVMMPGTDGLSTARSLRALPETAATPVVFMTAKIQPQDVAAYKQAGCLDVVPKPFDPASLPALLRDIWSRQEG
jgi:CheY-like chemotaxis protein